MTLYKQNKQEMLLICGRESGHAGGDHKLTIQFARLKSESVLCSSTYYNILFGFLTIELTLSPNPSLERNTTHLTLLWSPPFLWPGNRIQYYNITFTNRSTGSISYSRMNSTYNDQIVTFAREIQIQICSSTELKICISAISSVELLESFCVADRLLPLRKQVLISIYEHILNGKSVPFFQLI